VIFLPKTIHPKGAVETLDYVFEYFASFAFDTTNLVQLSFRTDQREREKSFFNVFWYQWDFSIVVASSFRNDTFARHAELACLRQGQVLVSLGSDSVSGPSMTGSWMFVGHLVNLFIIRWMRSANFSLDSFSRSLSVIIGKDRGVGCEHFFQTISCSAIRSKANRSRPSSN
jgi:hypothetical protein